MPKNTAIKLVNFLVALRQLPPLADLSGDEERLLFQLQSIWESRGELSVSDVYALGSGKSASTAYRYLISLKEKGMIDIKVDLSDKRRRNITFTKASQQLFAALT